ncbi:MAG: GGDEF domain-containing protein, partial [Lachnospiraceae bacterium]|nr:GGDEF domain-containing protein [Lachnospiraceae bacterium]
IMYNHIQYPVIFTLGERMGHITAVADFVAAFFTLIILFGTFRSGSNRKTSTRLFTWILVVSIAGMLSDGFSYAMEGIVPNNGFYLFINFMTYAASGVLTLLDAFYRSELINEKTPFPRKIMLPVVLLSSLNLLLLVIGVPLGKTFTIENYTYVGGPWELFPSIFAAVCMIYAFLVPFRYRKELGTRPFFALCSYMVFPAIAVGIRILFHHVDLIYLAIAASEVAIYVEIQAQIITEANIREKILRETALTDALTGLKNRRAYDALLKQEQRRGGLGAVFCDLNQLKHTNDQLGHEAGDLLLQRFAEILKEAFPEGEICRISGDEFVVLLADITPEKMEMRMGAFRDIINRNDRIAAFGYVYKENESILDMVREAETLMYEDKARYYKETGKDRRK